MTPALTHPDTAALATIEELIQLARTLRPEQVCSVAGLGTVRYVEAGVEEICDRGKLKILEAALRLMGDDKSADEIAAAWKITPRQAAMVITFTQEP
jgi:hypothetical protein